MVNWINGFKAGNKKEKYELNFRVLEIKACLFCDENCTAKRFRLMICNLGLEW